MSIQFAPILAASVLGTFSTESALTDANRCRRTCRLSGGCCCKSRKLLGANFPAERRSDRRSSTFVGPITLPRSPVSLPPGDEVPHIFTRSWRLKPRGFLISSAKRLLQQYRGPSRIVTVDPNPVLMTRCGPCARSVREILLGQDDPKNGAARVSRPN
jgi:hypothetical protein